MTLDALNTVETVDVSVSLVFELGPVKVSSKLVALTLLAEAVLGRFPKVFGDVGSVPMGMSAVFRERLHRLNIPHDFWLARRRLYHELLIYRTGFTKDILLGTQL